MQWNISYKAYRLIPLTPPLFFHFTLPLNCLVQEIRVHLDQTQLSSKTSERGLIETNPCTNNEILLKCINLSPNRPMFVVFFQKPISAAFAKFYAAILHICARRVSQAVISGKKVKFVSELEQLLTKFLYELNSIWLLLYFCKKLLAVKSCPYFSFVRCTVVTDQNRKSHKATYHPEIIFNASCEMLPTFRRIQ